MRREEIRRIIRDNAFVHTSGTPEEKKVAEYLRDRCKALGAKAKLESFTVEMAQVHSASLTVDGKEVPCKGYKCCGSGRIEGELMYLPNTDAASLKAARGKIVLLDTGVGYYLYRDLINAGVLGFITYDGNVRYKDHDIDHKELRSYVSKGEKILGVNINAKDAARLVRGGASRVAIEIQQTEGNGTSHNVVAELPGSEGKDGEWIVLTAHYDTTPLSVGSYDNLSGCIGLLLILEALKDKPLRCGLRFVFCGSEERGLLGSKAYVAAHKKELNKVVLNVNLDMIGSVMGKFIACVSAEEGLVHYLRYLGAELGFGIAPRNGVYSSDSTPFADSGVPALSFARLAPASQATIHNRYDTEDVLMEKHIQEDAAFIAEFVRRMATGPACPVKREMPESVKKGLDEYLNRKRKES